MLLPDNLQESDYWQSVYKQPVDYWQAALDTISQRHQLNVGRWERFSAGKNAVFFGGDVVIKLSPPFWRDDLWAEVEATQFVAGRLPVETARILATGEIGMWRYYVATRLGGELLRTHWKTLAAEDRVSLARQQGELMAALHSLPVAGQLPSFQGDWNTPMLEEQLVNCEKRMRKAGVPDVLLADLQQYLEEAKPLLAADTENWVLLHGDFDAGNIYAEQRADGADGWHITGLLDWGDARLGSIKHEFISPCVHSFNGERAALQAWYAGYGLTPQKQTPDFEHDVMARAMIYYADEFTRYLNSVPNAASCQTWHEVARYFWQMRE